jgi:hypothetical protein
MAQLLVNVLPVNALAGGASVAIPHLLESNGLGVAPTLVFPDRPTSIAVTGVTVTTVTFQNKGVATATANFRVERGWQPEVDASTVTPLLYGGAGNAVGGAGYFRAASLLSQVPNLVTGDLPVSVSIPANSFRAGSCVRMRMGASVNVSVANTGLTVTLNSNAAKTANFGTFTTAALAFGAPNVFTFSFCMEGVVGGNLTTTLTTTHGSYGGPGGATINAAPVAGGAFDTTVANVLTPSIAFSTPNVGTNLTLNYLVIDIAF